MNLHKVKQKGDKGLSKKNEKGRTFQHKKRQATLSRIASSDIIDKWEAEFPDDTKDDKNEKNDGKNEAEFPNDTSPVDLCCARRSGTT